MQNSRFRGIEAKCPENNTYEDKLEIRECLETG
jgi:hypothetical protein